MRFMALAALELHWGVIRPVDLGLRLFQVTIKAGLAGWTQRTVFPQELVAVQAITLAHSRDLDFLLRMADFAYLRRWGEPVNGN